MIKLLTPWMTPLSLAALNFSLFQIISTFIGSGFTIFLLNSITADINQPIVNIDIITGNVTQYLESHPLIDSVGRNDSLNNSMATNTQINKIGLNNITKFDTIIVNDGATSATNLVIQLSYPQGTIVDYYTSFQSENVSFQQVSQNLLTAKMDRMPKGALLDINTIVKCNPNANNANYTSSFINNNDRYLKQGTFLNCPPINHIVTASYDQGSTFLTDVNYPSIVVDKFYSMHSKEQLTIIVITLAVISFLMVVLYKRIKNFKIRLSRPKFVFNVVKEIVTIMEILETVKNNKKVFNVSLWFSKNDEERLTIFSNSDDYFYLDEFFLKLKERNELLLQKKLVVGIDESKSINKLTIDKGNTKISKDKKMEKAPFDLTPININNNSNSNNNLYNISEINTSCLDLANHILKKIDWKNYQDIEDKRYYTPVVILLAIVSAFVLSFTFEFYRTTVSQLVPTLPYIYYLILSLFIRGILFFMLATELINFKTLFAYEIGGINNVLSFFIMDEKSKIKLFIISLIIGCVPFLSILGNFQPSLTEGFHPLSRYGPGIEPFLLAVLIDIGLFMILILVIPKHILKEKIIRI